jgi:hypothetical protein
MTMTFYDCGFFLVYLTPFVNKVLLEIFSNFHWTFQIDETRQETLKVLKSIKQKQIKQSDLDEVSIHFTNQMSSFSSFRFLCLLSNL